MPLEPVGVLSSVEKQSLKLKITKVSDRMKADKDRRDVIIKEVLSSVGLQIKDVILRDHAGLLRRNCSVGRNSGDGSFISSKGSLRAKSYFNFKSYF